MARKHPSENHKRIGKRVLKVYFAGKGIHGAVFMQGGNGIISEEYAAVSSILMEEYGYKTTDMKCIPY